MKERLDVLLTERGFFPSREKARAAIMAGEVYIGEQRFDKAGDRVERDANIVLRKSGTGYVSRGGLKLEKAASVFGLSFTDLVCMDIGASTGGFTDFMLQNGARKVYAVDVGYGQLDFKLRNDPRVVNMEKENIRYFDCARIAESLDFISIDISFISLGLAFPTAEKLLSENGLIVALVKPQFEAGREQVGKNGIVREPEVQCEVIKKVISRAEELGLEAKGLSFSPIKGAKGNIEFLLLLKRKNAPETEAGDEAADSGKDTDAFSDAEIKRLVFEAHESFKADKNKG